MNESVDLAAKGKAIANKLIQAIEKDEQIKTTEHLSFTGIKDSIPEICQTVMVAIAKNNLNLLNTNPKKQGGKHGYVRSRQDFKPEELAREFFLLKQIIIAELKPQLITYSPEIIVEKMRLIDVVVNHIMENSFQTYSEHRKQQEESLCRQIFLTNQELNQLIEEHQDNISYLTHEINNPLTSIIGYSELFLRQPFKCGEKNNAVVNIDYIEKVLQQGKKILRIMKDTVELFSCSKKNFQLKIQKIDVGDLLESIVFSLHPSIEAKQLELYTHYSPQPLEIKSDSLRLQQIITNLLINAIRYTPSAGKIELTCELICQSANQNALEIIVADTGIGISKQDQKHIFKPYFRSKKSQDCVPEGIGLGLAIVNQLVTMLKGKIKLVSQVNVGSTFTVTIPLD
jgi:signal transduction histidine kinase